MKKIYKIVFLITLLITTTSLSAKSDSEGKEFFKEKSKINSRNAISNVIAPSATIAGNATVCQNAASPVITFTGSGGVAPYTFTYTITGVAGNQTIQTTSGNSVTVTQVTNAVGTFKYTLVSVKDNTSTPQVANGSATVTVGALPTANFSTLNQNNSIPICSSSPIDFLADQVQTGTTYKYLWNFGDNTAASTVNSAKTTHTFESFGVGNQTYNVDLTVTNTITGCFTIINNQPIIVKKSPDASLDIISTDGATEFDQSKNVFINCNATVASPNFLFKAVNASTTNSTNSGYTINWGDLSPTENIASSFTSVTHNYTKLGFFNITITSTNATTSCSTQKTYRFFNGNSPIGNLDSPGNANSCVPYSYTWNVDPGTFNNPPGTSYIFSVNDGSPPQTFTQETLTQTITHQFNSTSCGIGLPGNKFTVTFEITNPCDSNAPTTLVSSTQKPIAKYTISPTSTSTSYCVNKTLIFKNESEGYYGTSCNTNYNKTWTITPATGWTISSGTLTSENIGIVFNVAGNYDIKLAILQPGGDITNTCTNNEIIKTICIEPALTTPTITLTPTNPSNCAPLTVNASTPNIISNCTTPIDYLWTVTHTDLDCDILASDPTYLNSTTSASQNPVFNFTTPGTYSIRLKMTNSCGEVQSSIQTLIVKKPPKITVNPIANLCGGSAGSTIINPTAIIQNCGFTTAELVYNWSFPDGTPATSNAVAPQVTYTTGGSKTVSLFISVVGGCANSITSSQTFAIGTAPTLNPLIPATQSICSGSSTVALPLTAQSGTTFSWSATTVPAGVNVSPSSGNANSIPALTISNSNNTSKTVTLTIISTLNGCPSTNTYDIIVNPGPTLTQTVGSTICSGGTVIPLSVTVTPTPAAGTATYKWYSNTTGNTTVATSTLVNTSTVDGSYTPPATVGTIYYFCEVTFSSSGSCPSIKSDAVAITVNPGATINPQPIQTQNICVGATIATPLNSDYTGGTGIATYQWFKNSSDINTGGTLITGATNSSYTPPVFNAPEMAYYYVTITFTGNGCGPISCDPSEIKVFQDPTITSILPATQTLCSGVTPVDLEVIANGETALGNLSYQWFSNTTNVNSGGSSIFGATNATFTPPTSNAGTTYYYCVVSQNGMGCETASSAVSVTVNLAATITQQPQSSILCLGETPTLLEVAFINGVGTPQYQWYSNSTNTIAGSQLIIGATNPTFAPPDSTVGTVFYYCKITLPTGGCSELNSDFAEVTINQNPVIANKTAIICSGNTFTISPINAGSEIVPFGTTYTWSNPTISPSNAITGASAQNVAQTEISQTLINANTNPATVTYTVTPIVGVCSGVPFTVTVTVNPAISNPVTVTNSTCFGKNNGTIQTNITGGIPFSSGAPYQISWTGPNSYTSTNSFISNLAPGVYNLVVTDAGGCPFSNSYTITEPDDIIITTNLEKDITCFNDADGKIEITVSGGTLNYAYTWTKDGNAFSNVEDISNLSPGEYSITVSDANTCGPKTATFTITEPPILAVSLVSQTNVLCFGDSTGAITINTTGGTPTEVTTGVFDYKYAWTGPNGFTSSNQNLSGIAAGTYDLVVSDDSGCAKNLSVTITQSSEIVIKATTTPIACYGDDNASITVALSGGNPPYNVSWSNFAAGSYLDNLSAGDYLITVTDALSCVKTLNINIPETPIFTVNPVVKNITCFGAKNGSIKLNFVGGMAPVSFAWTDNATAGTDRNNLAAGTYTVNISDGKPCYITRTFTILEPQELVLTANTTNAFDCDDANSGQINLLVAGGSAPFNYSWSNGATTEDLTNIPAGNYSVTVTDGNGCSKTAQYNINRQPPIAIAVNTKTDADCDTRTIKQLFIADVSGGIPPYKLVWSSGTVSGANNEIMETTTNGTVQLTVTDSYGCTANYTFTVDTPELGTVSFSTSSYAFSTFGLYSVVDPIQFTNEATGDYETIAWNFGDGTVSTEQNPIHAYTQPGNYIVTETVTYPFGCVYVHTLSLLVEKGYVLEVPQAFTPNDDTLNDTMRPVFSGLKKVRIDIYDTWGSLVYSEEGETLKGWDGKIKGVQAENGNYFCKVQSETFYNLSLESAQPFTLIK